MDDLISMPLFCVSLVSGVSAASGLKNDQFDRKRNIQSFTFILSFDVGRSMFDVRCSFLRKFHTSVQVSIRRFLPSET
jgi:hypothetical protein